MNNTPNRYTLILLRDYANLSQVKISPFIFWLLVTLFISAFVFAFIGIVIAWFIWQNSIAIKLERDDLYKQLVTAQLQINRLTAIEDIVYKKNISLANTDRKNMQEKVNAQNTILQKHDAAMNKASENTTEKQPSLVSKNTPTPQISPQENISTSKKIVPPKTLLQTLESKIVALRNVKVKKQGRQLFLAMDIINTSKIKQSGTIQYTAVTDEGSYILIPIHNKRDNLYSINTSKTIRTTFTLPEEVTSESIKSLVIELIEEKKTIVRIVEKL